MEHNLRVCERCLMGIESREGSQPVRRLPVDEHDGICEWCENDGNETLYEFV